MLTADTYGMDWGHYAVSTFVGLARTENEDNRSNHCLADTSGLHRLDIVQGLDHQPRCSRSAAAEDELLEDSSG